MSLFLWCSAEIQTGSSPFLFRCPLVRPFCQTTQKTRAWPSLISGPLFLVSAFVSCTASRQHYSTAVKAEGGFLGPSQQEWPLVRCQPAVTSLCSRCHCPWYCCQNNEKCTNLWIWRVRCSLVGEVACCSSVVNLDVLFLLPFLYPFFCWNSNRRCTLCSYHFSICEGHSAKKTGCNGVPAERGANMALLWGQSYRMDNVMDRCLERGGWMGRQEGPKRCCSGGRGGKKIDRRQRERRGWRWSAGLQEVTAGKKRVKHISAVHTYCAHTHMHSCDYLINLHISRLVMLGEFTYSNECALSPYRDNFLLNRCGWNFHLRRDFVSSIRSSVAVDYV